MRKLFTRLFIVVVVLFFANIAVSANSPPTLTVLGKVKSPAINANASELIVATTLVRVDNNSSFCFINTPEQLMVCVNKTLGDQAQTTNLPSLQSMRGETTHILKHPMVIQSNNAANNFAENEVGESKTRVDCTLKLRSQIPSMEDLAATEKVTSASCFMTGVANANATSSFT